MIVVLLSAILICYILANVHIWDMVRSILFTAICLVVLVLILVLKPELFAIPFWYIMILTVARRLYWAFTDQQPAEGIMPRIRRR